MTNKEKRDFIASEIAKRIIGPGYTEGVFLCKKDASDEILSDDFDDVEKSEDEILIDDSEKNDSSDEILFNILS